VRNQQKHKGCQDCDCRNQEPCPLMPSFIHRLLSLKRRKDICQAEKAEESPRRIARGLLGSTAFRLRR
jgi:hypothetical protein